MQTCERFAGRKHGLAGRKQYNPRDVLVALGRCGAQNSLSEGSDGLRVAIDDLRVARNYQKPVSL